MCGSAEPFRRISGGVQDQRRSDESQQHFTRSSLIDFQAVPAAGVEDADAVVFGELAQASTSSAPQWNPAPKAVKQIRSPGLGPCPCHHSDAAINIEAEEVFP